MFHPERPGIAGDLLVNALAQFVVEWGLVQSRQLTLKLHAEHRCDSLVRRAWRGWNSCPYLFPQFFLAALIIAHPTQATWLLLRAALSSRTAVTRSSSKAQANSTAPTAIWMTSRSDDTRPLSARNDVRMVQTEPLNQDVEVTGRLIVKLWASSNAPDTDFTAKLIDFYPSNKDFPAGGFERRRQHCAGTLPQFAGAR